MIDTAPQPVPRRRTVPNGSRKPVWTRYLAKIPEPCDYCKANQRDDPFAPIARKARYRRRAHRQPDLLLCNEHASDQRVIDGLDPLRGVK